MLGKERGATGVGTTSCKQLELNVAVSFLQWHESGMSDFPTHLSVLREHRFSVEKPTIIHGDALQVLRRLDSGCVQCIVTSPPYWGLRDYNVAEQVGLVESLPQYLNRLTEVFAEARRVLADDGVFWLNIGDSFTSGNRGWRAPDRKNPARAMSVRPTTPDGLKAKDLIGLPWRLAFSLQEDGWYLRSDIVWNKPNAMPESVRDRPNRSHEFIFMFTKSERYKYDREAVRGPNGRNLRSVWNVNTKPFPGAHFATFPPELIEPCILTCTDAGDVVLDPFFGAGTVGLVAERHDRKYVGIELNSEYVGLAATRLSLAPKKVAGVAA
jgi:site-specific DNA-methyltransferase (cytosine-N4-specific)